MSKRQITIKPTCMREIMAFPTKRAALLWEKINQLVTNPFPDGKVKKKLRAGSGIFRLRVAEHRLFYRFGEDWVSLLGVRRRREDTYRGLSGAGSIPELPPDHDDDLDSLLASPAPATFTFGPEETSRPLPIEISEEWLKDLGVPASAFPFLVKCQTEDDLLEASVPEAVIDRVVEAIFPPSLDRVDQQPDLVVPSTEHLVRFKEGDLLGFLLRLDDDQLRLAQWAISGPTMVRGGAGTGKSTVALYRVKEVLERAEATSNETVLFTTYTRALVAVTRQLLEQILSPAQLARVRVATCDQVAWKIVSSRRRIGSLESNLETSRRLKTLRETFVPTAQSAFESRLRARALQRLSDAYLLEEFDWIIDGRELRTREEYLEAVRPGRGVAFPARLRKAVWDLHQVFCAGLTGERFPQLRNEALDIVRNGTWADHWDFVFVDEAQDLSPTSLSLMAEICKTPQGIFFAADAKQSIYSRSYTWSSAHPRLQFRGRTANLKRNYRSTQEIDQAAFSLLRPDEGEVLEPSTSVHEGTLPVLVRGVAAADEAEWVARFVRQMSRYLHLRSNAAAVLVPMTIVGERLAAELTAMNLPAKFYPGRELDLRSELVKVMTLYSAKGLEFPIVVLCGFDEGSYPVAEDFDDKDLFKERMHHERKLLYVGLTRAMRGLMLITPEDCRHEALNNLELAQWHVEDAR